MKKTLLLIICTLLIVGCAKNDANPQTSEAPIEEVSAEATEETETIEASNPSGTTHNYGEKVIMDGYSMDLQILAIDDHSYKGKIHIQFIYEFENTSSEDFNVSYNDFEGYADDYYVNSLGGLSDLGLTQEYNTLNGNIAPGKKIKGIIEFLAPENFQVFESRYTDKDGNHITYAVTRDQFEVSE